MVKNEKTTAGRRSDSEEPQRLSRLLPASRPPLTKDEREEADARSAAAAAAAERRRQEGVARRISVNRDAMAEWIGRRYAKCSIGNFAVTFAEQKAAVKQVAAYLDGLAANIEAGRGLILYGSVGTGKDHLLAASLFAAIDKGFEVAWHNAQTVFEGARDRMEGGGSEAAMLKRFTTPHVLGLSDPTPPAGDLSGFRVELLWRITDARYRHMRPIWLTMNGNSLEECQEKLSVPLWDRLQDGALCVPCFWPSYRESR